MLVLTFVFLSVIILKSIAISLFFGVLLAYVIHPIYNFLVSRFRWKTTIAFLLCVGVIVVFVVPLVFFTQALVQESYLLYSLMKQKMAVGFFQGCHNQFCDSVRGFMDDPEVSYQLQEILKTATNWVIAKGSAVLLSVPKLLVHFFILFLTMFYTLRDGHLLLDKIHQLMELRRQDFIFILQRLRQIVRGVVYGYFLVAVVQGIFGALGFFLFGVSSPLFWGLVMAFLALIPYFGPAVIWVPASLFLFFEGVFQDSTSLMVKGAGLFVYSLFFVSTLDNILKSKLMGDKADVHPAIIMFGIFGGMFLFGPLGVFIGPLVLALTATVLEVYVLKSDS